MNLEGKVAIVTGGAGGIGRGVTKALGKRGAKVLVTDIAEEGLASAKAEFDALGLDVTTIVCDGAKEEQVKAAVQKCIDTYGRLDIVVNNAHASKQKPFTDLTIEDMNLSLNTGLWATFFFMQQAFPHLKKTKGCIVNFASGAGIVGQPLQGAYAAAKEGIRALTRVAAHEWGEFGVRVNLISPLALTPGVKKWSENFPEAYQETVNKVPLHRLGDPELDIGRPIAFLCSDDASYITGQMLTADGGSDIRP